MDTVKIAFNIETSDAACPLGVKVCLDDTVLLNHQHVTEKIEFWHDIRDDDGQHTLSIEIFGKTTDHTKVDEQGNIIRDAVLQISGVTIDGIDVHQLFLDRCKYTHDFNGTQATVIDTFHGAAGCNGIITFEFSTPIYLWLLENM